MVRLTSGNSFGRYRLRGRIGAGAMGEVWEALDPDLGRKVAIKLLPDALSHDVPRIARFKREAQALAALNHPNIVTVHSVEEAEGVPFLTMELVCGTTLSDRISEQGMSVSDILELAVPLADALTAAHESGITHRDLKPANVMVTDDGRVKILDFGLAKVRLDDRTADSLAAPQTITGAGRILGTPRYMSPEQLEGKPTDGRSDIFSLGVMLYEMATGRPPFEGAGLGSLMSAILNEDPPSVSEVRDDLPDELGRIVRHCLRKDPEHRYQAAKELRNELEELAQEPKGRASRPAARWVARRGRWLAAGGLLALTILGAWFLRNSWPGAMPDTPAVLVLPFEIRGEQQAGGMLGLSLAEAVAVDLAPAENLRVLPVNPASAGEDPIAAGKRSGCRYVITGAVVRSGLQVSLTIQLVNVDARRLVGGAEANGSDAELGMLMAAVTGDVAESLGARFAHTYGMIAGEVSNPDLRVSEELGEFRSAYGTMDMPRIVEAARKLVAAFPAQPEAHALRVYAWFLKSADDPSPDTLATLEESLRALEQLDPRMPYLDLGRAQLSQIRRGPRAAIPILDRLLERTDLTAKLRGWVLRIRSHDLASIGEDERALRDARGALDLDPANPWAFTALAGALSRLGRDEEALELNRRAVGLRPTLAFPHMLVGVTLLKQGRANEAVAAFETATHKQDSWQEPVAYLALALRHADRPDEAETTAAEAGALSDAPAGVFVLARERALAGRRSEALALLRRSRELGFVDATIATVPEFRQLHGDPEFEAIRSTVEDLVRDPEESH